jgi:CubicO group peptidase (beta-lactamase class C family)
MARCCLLLVLAIVGGGFAAAGAHALTGTPAPAGPGDQWAAIRGHVTAEMARLQTPGASVAIVREGDVVFAEGFGRAGADGRAVEADTPFAIASVSKWITAVAVLRLVDVGLVDLDAPVSDYLAEFRGRADDITILDLLSHTSGWSTADGLRNWADASGGPDALRRNARTSTRTRTTTCSARSSRG